MLDWCDGRGRGGDPVRRRLERGRRGRAAGWATTTGRVSIDLEAHGPRARGRRDLARGADPGRRHGPALEEQLRPHGLTLRHFPQSFEFSTLGGWIATRAGGHYATLLHPHRRLRRVDPRAHAARLVGEPAPAGLGRRAEPRPHADRLRGHPRRDHRGLDAGAGRAAASGVGRGAVRLVRRRRAGGARAVAVGALPAELPAARPGRGGAHRRRPTAAERRCSCSASSRRDHPLDAPGWRERSSSARDHGGDRARRAAEHERDAASRGRRLARRVPRRRPTCATRSSPRGIIAETFETAITWDRFEDFRRDGVTRERRRARRSAAGARVTCRFTHVYPDGAGALLHGARARPGAATSSPSGPRSRQAASEAIVAAGGTITHHHAVGRDHRPWYDRQRPEPFAAALRAAKSRRRPRRDPQPRRADRPLEGLTAWQGDANWPAPTGCCRDSGGCACRCRGPESRTATRTPWPPATASCSWTRASTSPVRCASSSSPSTRLVCAWSTCASWSAPTRTRTTTGRRRRSWSAPAPSSGCTRTTST